MSSVDKASQATIVAASSVGGNPAQAIEQLKKTSSEAEKSKESELVRFPPCVVHSLYDIRGMAGEAEMELQDKTVAARNGGVDNGEYSPQRTPNPPSSPWTEAPPSGEKLWCMSRLSNWISWVLEKGFFNVGIFVGTYPWLTIIVMMIMCLLCGVGMKTFHETKEQEKLWVPRGSRLLAEKKWINQAFPMEARYVTVLLVQKGGNMLTPQSLNALYDLYEEAVQYKVGSRSYEDLCLRAGPNCFVSSLLELWFYNVKVIRNLTHPDIVERINSHPVSPISGVDVSTLLGGDVERDQNGRIIRAEATQITWLLNDEKDNTDAAAFEKHTIDLALKGHPNISNSYVYGTRSFLDEGYGAINDDINLLSAGFSIVFAFVMLALGKFNLLEQKIYVSVCGIVCVGLAILVAYGLATAMDIIYTPIQSIMPFLVLGIGVDDMFVVVETWKNLKPEETKVDVPLKLALALSRSGVSITVTSITDIVAFGIGASTVIPALSAFCIYASLGVFAMYVLVSTLFSAVLAIDERRIRSRRDACLPCRRYDSNYQPNKCSTGPSILQKFFGRFYGPFIIKTPVKVVVSVIAVAMSGIGLWRFILMEHDFDLVNYIPSSSYAHSFVKTKREYFERQGISTNIYCGEMNYFEQRHRLNSLYHDLTKSPDIQPGTIRAWFMAFNHTAFSNETAYYQGVAQFLNSRAGAVFRPYVKLKGVDTGQISIVASYITMNHIHKPTSAGRVKSMDNLRDIIDSKGFPKFSGPDLPQYKCMAYCIQYMSYETNKVLQPELYRNLALAAAAVFVVTFVLIANLWTSTLVFICVFFTVVDVGGVLELWGTTIDTASSILLTLCVGLAVDFSAHIGHTFMTIPGSRKARVVSTLADIGPAVFNGGFSTFLAFVLLANSRSYGFLLFFRVFFSVVVFGMFHGLVFLPVILSTMGSPAYHHHTAAAPNLPDHSDSNPRPEDRPACRDEMEGPMSVADDDKLVPMEVTEINGHTESASTGHDGPCQVLYSGSDDIEQKQLSSSEPEVPVSGIEHKSSDSRLSSGLAFTQL
ncbi:patched domain-containing protein 3 [Elysia marginata]|uniref:Patched domain-containing protein 3 n=1 Tax=Elysia marginata TaxID=1093978 RepID=A0AAV4ELR0_9GAST|nr:patched domain-containing protein 3 [Elysia marginata]